ncbi:sporulation protein YqfC [Geomicrobium sp. JSM 1781026]|uniref:sporulation protein YqfC n=1 Tax=Geomicrobium sp. JSM 1781026 TaxID=3344580 RepID=UPI0035C224EE
MASISRKLRKLMTKSMQIPADVTLGLSRVTMIGHVHVYIENHRGILSFSSDNVQLRLSDGELLVTGKEMIIKAILPDELILEGQIDQVAHIHKKGEK